MDFGARHLLLRIRALTISRAYTTERVMSGEMTKTSNVSKKELALLDGVMVTQRPSRWGGSWLGSLGFSGFGFGISGGRSLVSSSSPKILDMRRPPFLPPFSSEATSSSFSSPVSAFFSGS
jgi:hypothetical protein